MSPSKLKYKEAIQAAKDFVYGKLNEVPGHFDLRQTNIFNKKLFYFKSQFSYWDSVNEDMWLAYTGKTEEQYYSDKGVTK